MKVNRRRCDEINCIAIELVDMVSDVEKASYFGDALNVCGHSYGCLVG